MKKLIKLILFILPLILSISICIAQVHARGWAVLVGPDAVQLHLGVDKRQQPYARMQGGDPGTMVLQRLSGKDWEKILEEREKRVAALKEDIKKYNEIVSSPFGKDMKESAWKSLVAKYPEAAEGAQVGDTEGLLRQAYGKIVNSIGMKFVYISPGTFMMGSPANEKDRDRDETRHQVTLTKGFYMQTTEVTQAQWKAVMGNNPSNSKNCGDDCPVEYVSWNDVQEFIKRLNRKEGSQQYRLPTEAEWEYACRAGSTMRFYFGDNEDELEEYAWYSDNSGKKTHPVGQKKPNAWGLYDMYGNVWEWCEDWYGDYPSGSINDPIGSRGGSRRVVRGGSWYSETCYCRSAYRSGNTPGTWNCGLGFRLLRMH